MNDKINQGADSVNYRVANLTNDIWSDGSTSYWHKSLGGYHGAKLKRIQELYEQRLSADIDTISYALQTPFADSILATESIVNMLNTKYFMFYTYNEKDNRRDLMFIQILMLVEVLGLFPVLNLLRMQMLKLMQ